VNGTDGFTLVLVAEGEGHTAWL